MGSRLQIGRWGTGSRRERKMIPAGDGNHFHYRRKGFPADCLPRKRPEGLRQIGPSGLNEKCFPKPREGRHSLATWTSASSVESRKPVDLGLAWVTEAPESGATLPLTLGVPRPDGSPRVASESDSSGRPIVRRSGLSSIARRSRCFVALRNRGANAPGLPQSGAPRAHWRRGSRCGMLLTATFIQTWRLLK